MNKKLSISLCIWVRTEVDTTTTFVAVSGALVSMICEPGALEICIFQLQPHVWLQDSTAQLFGSLNSQNCKIELVSSGCIQVLLQHFSLCDHVIERAFRCQLLSAWWALPFPLEEPVSTDSLGSTEQRHKELLKLSWVQQPRTQVQIMPKKSVPAQFSLDPRMPGIKLVTLCVCGLELQ